MEQIREKTWGQKKTIFHSLKRSNDCLADHQFCIQIIHACHQVDEIGANILKEQLTLGVKYD